MKYSERTKIEEFTQKNGKIGSKVYFTDYVFCECRTEKSAKSTADKLERFNGSLYKPYKGLL